MDTAIKSHKLSETVSIHDKQFHKNWKRAWEQDVYFDTKFIVGKNKDETKEFKGIGKIFAVQSEYFANKLFSNSPNTFKSQN